MQTQSTGKALLKVTLSTNTTLFELRRGGGGGCTLIFSCILRLGLLFWVQTFFEFQYFLGFSEKLISWGGGMKILWIFFGGSSQNWTLFKGHFFTF